MSGTPQPPGAWETDETRWQAVLDRDPAGAGQFVYAVRTTGVYCRPDCAAKRPNPANVRFFNTPGAARAAGFRPCRRCRPDATPDTSSNPHAAQVVAACRRLEQGGPAPTLAALAREAGLSPSRFHTVFTAHTGVTPRAYASALQARRVRESLSECDQDPIGQVIQRAGYASNGRFYEESTAMLGMTPGAFRNGGSGVQMQSAVGQCALGAVLVAATERGVCAILLGEDPDALRKDLARRFPAATIVDGGADFEAVVAAVIAMVERPAIGLDLPLDIRGTAFQQRVWNALRAIPAGSTTTYAVIAAQLGQPGAVRAVAGACAANPLAVVVPCHRVLRSNGSLSGYRWGVSRKAALLERERDESE